MKKRFMIVSIFMKSINKNLLYLKKINNKVNFLIREMKKPNNKTLKNNRKIILLTTQNPKKKGFHQNLMMG